MPAVTILELPASLTPLIENPDAEGGDGEGGVSGDLVAGLKALRGEDDTAAAEKVADEEPVAATADDAKE